MFKYIFLFIALFFIRTAACSTILTAEQLTKDDVVTLFGSVDVKTSFEVISKIHELQSVRKTEPIYLLIDSDGGSVVEGAKIIDAMQASHRKINTVIIGEADSMAAYIHSYGYKRYMTASSYLMFHFASWGYKGDVHSMANRANLMINMMLGFELNVCNRSGKFTLNFLQEREAREWWVLSNEALNYNLIDDIAIVENYNPPKPKSIKSEE